MAHGYTTRVVATAFGSEFVFSVLVPLAYVRAFELTGRGFVPLVIVLYLVKTTALILYLARLLRPIERWLATAQPDDALTCRAGRTAYDTPLVFASVWAAAWTAMCLAIGFLLPAFGVEGPPPGQLALFSFACAAAAFPLAYGILQWCLGPVAGRISVRARAHGITLPGRHASLRVKLLTLCVSVIAAPTLWMEVLVQRRSGDIGTLVLFGLVAVTWSVSCGAFLAAGIADPLQRIGAVIAQIVHQGGAERLERVPQYYKDEIGELAAAVNTMVDRLQATSAERERLLALTAARSAELQAVLDNIVDLVFACDAAGRITLANAAGLRLLGVPPPAASRPAAELLAAAHIRHPDGRPFSSDELPLARALAGETVVQENEVLASPASRRDVFLRSSAAPIRDGAGAIIGAVEVARDISEAIVLDQLKDQFIRVAAHELKTPVAIMKAYALLLLRDREQTPANRKMLQAIDRGAERLTRIIEELLDASHALLGRQRITVEPFDLGTLVRKVVGEATPTAAGHHIVVHADTPVRVVGDAAQVEQVLVRLLRNAIKYSPGGEDIEVSLGVSDWRQAVVSVRDRGIGIPRDKQARVFQLFYGAHTDTPHDYGGMGVGLFLSRQTIEAQGGRMWFESEEARGSTFSFSLPLA